MRYALLILLALFAFPACAYDTSGALPDAAQEARARDLFRELRCMVCQNQSIDDSDAPLARDLRLLVRERLTAGDTDRQVLDFLTARYGQFVLLKPRFGWDTALLWFAPAAVLLLGGAGLVSLLRRRRRAQAVPDEQPLTEAERRRLTELLRESEPSTTRSS
jgi:cytochrome c-type biogenesis protein CcmH